jgi:hypothetical protein
MRANFDNRSPFHRITSEHPFHKNTESQVNGSSARRRYTCSITEFMGAAVEECGQLALAGHATQ